MKRLRIYADTSVFGGCFDEEFSRDSLRLFEEIKSGNFILILSDTTLRELHGAPAQVKEIIANIPMNNLEIIPFSDEIDELREAYLAAGIVGPLSADDAEHIACASIADVDLIVSWNFKHIVHFEKIKQYQAVNMLKGYHIIPIHTPREVVSNEEENV
ncbi:MAG: PIN domain protein [Candidatus Sumerlaeota bacterium]|nr:PIN domain protein [Candidatus Sumerlaeota bacterium]